MGRISGGSQSGPSWGRKVTPDAVGPPQLQFVLAGVEPRCHTAARTGPRVCVVYIGRAGWRSYVSGIQSLAGKAAMTGSDRTGVGGWLCLCVFCLLLHLKSRRYSRLMSVGSGAILVNAA